MALWKETGSNPSPSASGTPAASGTNAITELQGNVDAAKQLDVLSTGVVVGDVKASSITVAAGARMRGHVEFGWDEKHSGVEHKGTPRLA
jgi:uncharacterized cupredoxin-like copper-binding protein